MGSKGSNTTTTSTAPNPAAMGLYQQLLGQASNVAATPYTAYTGELTAPVNAQQQAGIGNINQYATAALPYMTQAGGLMQSAANPLTQQQISQYYNPYQQQVINATEQQFQNTNAQQQQEVLGNAAAQGALGGNRTAIAQATLAGQQQAQEAPVIAGLEQQGYNTALTTAAQEFQQNPEAAAYGLAGVGQGVESAGLTGANAQVGAGTLEQQTQQAQDTAAYQQFLNQQAYPFQTTQWLAGLGTGVGSQMGGTSSTTQPPPSLISQLAGLGTLGVGAGSMMSGLGGAAGFAALLARGGSVGHQSSVPETHETLVAQQRQLIHGRRPAQFFPHGTAELRKPHGIERVETHDGVFHFDPNKISADQIKTLSAQGRENELLNLGPFSRHHIMERIARGEKPLAVVERQRDGTEVRAAAGTHVTAPHQIAAMRHTMTPGNQISVEDPATTIGQRQQRHSGGVVQGLATGGGSMYPQFGGGYGAPVQPYSGGQSWIPNTGIVHGQEEGAPQPPRPPQQDNSATQMFQNAMRMAGGMGNKNPAAPSGGPVGPIGTSPEAGNIVNAPTGSMISDNAIFKRGGAVARPYGGLPLPSRNRIELKRGGMGLASFLPLRQRGGLASGGDPEGAPPTPADIVDSRWAAPPVPAAMYGNDPTANIMALRAYGQLSPMAPQGLASPAEGPQGADVPDQGAGIVPAMPQGVTPGLSAPMAYAPEGGGGIAPPAGAPMDVAPQGGVAPMAAPPPQETPSRGGLFSPDVSMALMSAGLGMMASRSPFPLVGIGEGGMQGLGTYGSLQQQHLAQHKEETDVALKVRQLDQQAKTEQDRLAQEAKQFSLQQAEFGLKQLQPVKIGTDVLGRDVLAVRSPSGSYLPIDPATGQPSPGGIQTGAPGAPGSTQIGPLPGPAENAAQMIANYEIPPLAGFVMQKPYGQAVMGRVKELNGDYNAQNYNMSNAAYKAFATGTQGNQVRFFNNSVQHLGTLDSLIDAMGSGDVRLINAARNAFQNQFGGTAPGNFDAAKNIVGQEVVKSIVANGGGEREREEAAATLAAAKSPEQLKGIIDTYKELAGAQLRDLKLQYQQSTFRHDFDKLLIPEARTELQKVELRAAQRQPSAASPSGAPISQAALQRFATPDAVHAAIAAGTLRSGDRFLDSAGTTRTVP